MLNRCYLLNFALNQIICICRDETKALPLLFMLTPDEFTEHVLTFCERDEVVDVMTIASIRNHFRLDESFCRIHGTRPVLDTKTSAMNCNLCFEDRMHKLNFRRCDICCIFLGSRRHATWWWRVVRQVLLCQVLDKNVFLYRM